MNEQASTGAPAAPIVNAAARLTGMGVSPSGAWFAWGVLTGLALAGVSIYLIRKRL